jgi:hypothetical protein
VRDERFDDLARRFAAGMSRRQFLKLLLSGLGSSLVGLLGYKLQENAYVASGAAGEAVYKSFLPLVANSCQAASACGARNYCNEAETCLCIRSAEGEIRCGEIPSTCDVKLCQTSADCADLGEGYFCDSPNSGCCSDPPAELPRCIAPCPPPCPPDKICGSQCCQEGEYCISGACVACSAELFCNGVCCAGGESCIAGHCVQACADDEVTIASLDAARAALAAGATQVDLSPGGCHTYTRSLNATKDMVTTEQILMGNRPVITWFHSASQSDGSFDDDLDAYAETRITIHRGVTFPEQWVKIDEYSTQTKTLTRRETYTRSDELTLHVVVEADNGSGTLAKEVEFDTTLIQSTSLEGVPLDVSQGIPGSVANDCSASETTELNNKMKECLVEGFKCMGRNDRMDIANHMIYHYMRRNVSITCEPLPLGSVAQISIWDNFMEFSGVAVDIDIFVDRSKWYDDNGNPKLTPEQQCNILFHEMLHLRFGAHNPMMIGTGRFQEIDPTYACAGLCFGGVILRTKCACARCLKTNVCDKRCEPFDCCDPDLGAWCPCPCRYKYYPTRTQCEVECPSGLCCFAYQCKPIDVSGECDVLCP